MNYPRLKSLLLVPAANGLSISCRGCKDFCRNRATGPNCCAGVLSGCGIGYRLATAPHADVTHFAFPTKRDGVLLGLKRKLAGRDNTAIHFMGSHRVRNAGLLKAFYCGPRTMFPVCFMVHVGGMPTGHNC